MDKHDKITPIKVEKAVEKKAAPVEPMPPTGCVVCGSYAPELTETAGNARWHKACGESRPDVIAKIRARA